MNKLPKVPHDLAFGVNNRAPAVNQIAFSVDYTPKYINNFTGGRISLQQDLL